jgi:hypothetical protein
LAERDANPRRYTWNAKGEDILGKIQGANRHCRYSYFGDTTPRRSPGTSARRLPRRM